MPRATSRGAGSSTPSTGRRTSSGGSRTGPRCSPSRRTERSRSAWSIRRRPASCSGRRGTGAWADGVRLRVSFVDHLAEAMLVNRASTSSPARRRATLGRVHPLVEGMDRQRGTETTSATPSSRAARRSSTLECGRQAVGHRAAQGARGGGGRTVHRFRRAAGTIYSGTALASNGRLHAGALALLAGPSG